MILKLRGILLFILLLIMVVGCLNQPEIEIPEQIKDLENLTIYRQTTQQPVDTVELTRERSFESGNEVFIDGFVGEFAVDDSGRVFVCTSNAGTVAIYVFDSEGNYITTVGRYGHGPGEYESIGSMSIRGGKLYIFDARLQKMGIFSLTDFRHIRDEVISRDQLNAADSLARQLRGFSLVATENGQLVIGLRSTAINRDDDHRKIVYYKLTKDGTMLSGPLLELKRFRFYFPENRNSKKLPISMPFSRSSLLSVSDDGRFFTAWTEDFLIKKYNADGEYKRAIYYPVEKSDLNIDELDLGRYKRSLIKNKDLPETWPALHTMELDNEGRLWVATITNSDSTYTWWVLNQKGDVLAKFRWAGERASRSVMSTPEIVIKNGYLYKREVDIRAGINSIAQYRIRFSTP